MKNNNNSINNKKSNNNININCRPVLEALDVLHFNMISNNNNNNMNNSNKDLVNPLLQEWNTN